MMRSVQGLALVLLLAQPAAAQGQTPPGDPSAGRQLAETWCANCHLTGPDQRSATSNGAPTFAAIAKMPAMTPAALGAFLRAPHDRMPDLHLSGTNIDDVVAYIATLRTVSR